MFDFFKNNEIKSRTIQSTFLTIGEEAEET